MSEFGINHEGSPGEEAVPVFNIASPVVQGGKVQGVVVVRVAAEPFLRNFDAALPILLKKRPDVIAITGDHSTPCAMHGHSWHPQPLLLNSAVSGSDKLDRFTETGANSGSLGIFPAKFLIRLMQANAKMFDKFGA